MMRRKVLLVDDDPAFTRLVKLNLEATGRYEVCEDNNPATALMMAHAFHPDVILLDIVMPEIDGGDLRAMFREDPALRNTPTVFLTALVDKHEVDRHQGHFADGDFLAKPVSPDELMDCIEAHLPS